MFRRSALVAVFGAGVLLGACTTPQQRVEDKENLLAAAGFTARPANTPERQTMLHSLPPDKFVQRQRGDGFVYLFADPLVCNCLYIGDQVAYGRYRQEVLQRQIANDQVMAAQMNEDAGWNWGSWGPGWWY